MGFVHWARYVLPAAAGLGIGIFGAIGVRAADEQTLSVQHADCTFFLPAARDRAARQARDRFARSGTTQDVVRRLGAKLPPLRGAAGDPGSSGNLIDSYIFAALKDAGVAPAPRTTDYEFVRRVTLDLTGRIPTPDRVQSFVADGATTKRTQLIDELLNKPEWVDKWTMYLGDHFKNASNKTAVRMYDDGRNAFYAWIKDALNTHKPYNQMTREIIAARGTNSYMPEQGAVNWLVGGRVVNGPQQDIWDQQVANVAETFLGIAHLNCLGCHNGRGHLDQISLWGSQASRYQAWQMSAFLSHSNEARTNIDPTMTNSPYYWGIVDDVKPYTTDYALNTTTGNRPARQPIGTQKTVPPAYLFGGAKPQPGENYRDALARLVTGDFQFARATVNYFWAEFFGRGIVDPPNQFDPLRLDADHPPPDPWTLQPSNPRLLDALAQDFIDHGYDLRYLMKVLTTSEAYQLSSRYDGAWNPNWEPLFARHLVRRLWGEEVMDALAQSSGVFPTYTVNTLPKFNYAMQAPEPLAILKGNNVLTAFMPGNRDDQERKTDSAVQQGLAMMNDALVMARTRATGTGSTGSLLMRVQNLAPADMVDQLFLNVLSRHPSAEEKAAALAALATGNRQQKVEDLLWSLYNKVDFLFNY